MTRPIPERIEPGQVLERARAVVQADRFPHLATVDGDQPRLRPVSPVRTDGFTVYVANLRAYNKTTEIAVMVNEPLGGTWRMIRSSHEWTKSDAWAASFSVPVAADGTAVLKYRVRVNY